MSKGKVAIYVMMICGVALIVSSLVVIFRAPDEQEEKPNPFKAALEQVEKAQKDTNDEIMRFLKAEDEYLDRESLGVRMAGYRKLEGNGE